MASTGKTTNYELSQFIGTDKPSWLGDYNGDMLKIDTALGSINATATTAQSGVASAQSAASAAQQTANAAQQKATANAQDITELKTALTNTVIKATNNANVTSGSSALSYSDYIQVFKIVSLFNLTNYTDSSTERRIPLASVTGNIFKIGMSTLADDSSKVYMGPASVRGTEKSSSRIEIFAAPLNAYYDGANTVFYLAIGISDFSSYSFDYVWATCVTLFSGNFLSPTVISNT